MPTYEYRCKSCGEHLEVVQAFSDDPLTDCPTCGGTLKKVFNPVGIAFKGSGFYKTDSRSSSSGGTSSSSGGTSSGSKTSSSDSGSTSQSDSSSSSDTSSSDSGSTSSTTTEAATA